MAIQLDDLSPTTLGPDGASTEEDPHLSTKNDEEDDEYLSDLVKIGMAVNKYGFLVVLAIGIVGNLLTIVVMRRPSMKKSTTSIYFINLAVADLYHLLDYMTGRWGRHIHWNP